MLCSDIKGGVGQHDRIISDGELISIQCNMPHRTNLNFPLLLSLRLCHSWYLVVPSVYRVLDWEERKAKTIETSVSLYARAPLSSPFSLYCARYLPNAWIIANVSKKRESVVIFVSVLIALSKKILSGLDLVAFSPKCLTSVGDSSLEYPKLNFIDNFLYKQNNQ